MTANRPIALDRNLGGTRIRTAMVLAAGLGTRMRPLTAERPKPLVEVAGKPLLGHVLERLRASRIERVVVNVHYLPDAIEDYLRNLSEPFDIIVSDERTELLETGGGITRALPLIADDTFAVINSDNLWIEGPVDAIRLMGARWDDGRMDALLLMVPLAAAHCYAGNGDFRMDGLGRLSRRVPAKPAPFVYTGIQLVSRRLFEGAPDGRFSTNLLWDRAISNGRVYGMVHEGLWFEVGTPDAIGKAEALLGMS